MKSSLLITLIIMIVLGASTSPSLWADEDPKEWKLARAFYEDKTARRVGDLITVIIDEETEASKDAESSSSKQSGLSGSMSFGHPQIDSNPTPWTNAVVPAWSLDTSRSFAGSGTTGNKESLKSTIAARVMEVLPNSNLLIEGKRTVMVQDEEMQVIMTGIIRPKDISKENTVPSSVIADAAIRYVSSGPTIKNQKRGIITALWNWLNPF